MDDFKVTKDDFLTLIHDLLKTFKHDLTVFNQLFWSGK
jgi:hypothetical protein